MSMTMKPLLLLCCLLLIGAGLTLAQDNPTPVPTLQPSITPIPLLPPDITATPIIIIEPTLPPNVTPTATITPEGFVASPTALPIDPLAGDAAHPPIELDLPEGWQTAYNSFVFNDFGELRIVPFALYAGPVEGGIGYIVLLWGFTNITGGNPFTGDSTVNLYLDGRRLLRLVILETGCNIGTDLEHDYIVGEYFASGTSFAAVDCPTTTDTRGWYAALNVDDLNFAFYLYTEPIEAMDGPAKQQLQAIMDSVTFYVKEFRAGEWGVEVTAEPDTE